MPSKIVLPKFKLSCGLNAPGGIKNCSLLKISSKSSGNPEGKLKRFGVFKENGIPKPGMPGPLGNSGIGIDTSLGEQGDI